MARKSTRLAHPKKKAAERSELVRAKAQARFLRAYERLGTIVHAADRARINRRSHYDWLEQDTAETPTGYRARFEASEEIAIQSLEREMRRRAIEGVEEPIYYQGAVCGRVRKYSDTLLIFALKAKRREVYADRFEHTGKGGTPLLPPAATMTTPELIAETEALLARLKGKP